MLIRAHHQNISAKFIGRAQQPRAEWPRFYRQDVQRCGNAVFAQYRRQFGRWAAGAHAGQHKDLLSIAEATQRSHHRFCGTLVVAPGDGDTAAKFAAIIGGHHQHGPIGGEQRRAQCLPRRAIIVLRWPLDHHAIGAAATFLHLQFDDAVDVDPVRDDTGDIGGPGLEAGAQTGSALGFILRSVVSRCDDRTSSLGENCVSGGARTTKALIRVAPLCAASCSAAPSSAPAASGWSSMTRMTPAILPGLTPSLRSRHHRRGHAASASCLSNIALAAALRLALNSSRLSPHHSIGGGARPVVAG